ncbi:MAG: DUF6226 family protein [Acidipropionibacterium sp.]|jgi:hypothetical protein|nr:DUF6226 family protein [Acidipropionibacterium sp.]
MSIIDEVTASVDAVFSQLDAPSWPDPHAERRTVEEEYGRVTHPGRFRALRLRLEAWRERLVDDWGVELAESSVPRTHDADLEGEESTATASLWTSPREGTLPLRVTVSETGGVTCIQLGIGDDAVDFGCLPECACDACDAGSAALLADLDAFLISVISGNLVVVIGPAVVDGSGLERPSFLVVATEEDWLLQGEGPAETAEIVDAVRSGDDPHLPAGCVVHHGAPWIA